MINLQFYTGAVYYIVTRWGKINIQTFLKELYNENKKDSSKYFSFFV